MIPRRLWQVSICTTVEGEEVVSGLMERVFAVSPSVYQNEKSGEVMVSVYSEALPKPPRALRLYLEDALGCMRSGPLNLGPAKLVIKPLRRENWAESWKRHFHPIKIGKRLLIKPSWSRCGAGPGQCVVILDPGLSFGTGQHPTTLFCLTEIVRCRRRGVAQSFLDIGAGSGILAIAAAKLGHSPVIAFDNDPEAVRASRHNIKRNKVHVTMRRADLTRLPQSPWRRYDFISANLIGDLLTKEAGKLRHLLKPGGKLVLAGILLQEFSNIESKLREFNLTLEKSWTKKEWKSGRFALVQFMQPGTV